MELYEQQQFDFLLHTAVERFTERLIQHNQGAKHALARLRQAPNALGVRRDTFVEAFFSECLMDNPAGACFVLKALADQPAPAFPDGGRVSDLLIQSAKAVFARLLHQKTEEMLEQSTLFEEESP